MSHCFHICSRCLVARATGNPRVPQTLYPYPYPGRGYGFGPGYRKSDPDPDPSWVVHPLVFALSLAHPPCKSSGTTRMIMRVVFPLSRPLCLSHPPSTECADEAACRLVLSLAPAHSFKLPGVGSATTRTSPARQGYDTRTRVSSRRCSCPHHPRPLPLHPHPHPRTHPCSATARVVPSLLSLSPSRLPTLPARSCPCPFPLPSPL